MYSLPGFFRPERLEMCERWINTPLPRKKPGGSKEYDRSLFLQAVGKKIRSLPQKEADDFIIN